MCFDYAYLKGLVSLVFTPFDSYTISASSSTWFPERYVKDLTETSHLGPSLPRFLTLHNVRLCLCVLHLLKEEASLLTAEQSTHP